jgi:hypothetical protein
MQLCAGKTLFLNSKYAEYSGNVKHLQLAKPL